MKKRSGCFFFLLLYLAGLLLGVLGSRWLYPSPSQKDNGKEKAGEELELYQSDPSASVSNASSYDKVSDGERPDYPGEQWKKRLFWQYVLYGCLTVVMLEIKRNIVPVLAGWFLYGSFAGIYLRGMVHYYGRFGRNYCLVTLLIVPVLLALLTGVYWMKENGTTVPYYPYNKRIRDLLYGLRIRLFPAVFYLAALFLCYIADYEIIMRVRWSILLRMLGNVVD